MAIRRPGNIQQAVDKLNEAAVDVEKRLADLAEGSPARVEIEARLDVVRKEAVEMRRIVGAPRREEPTATLDDPFGMNSVPTPPPAT